MGTIGIRVTDTLDSTEMAFVVKRFEAGQFGMESDRIVEFENFFGADAKARASARVVIVGVWNQRIETVVAAGHLQDDENRAVAASGDLGSFVRGVRLQRRKGVREERGDGPRDGGAECSIAEEFAARFER